MRPDESGAQEARQAALRRRAEEKARERLAGADDLSPEAILGLIQDLQVHQIELELQNEDLRQTQQDLAASRDRYTDLYDFAPVGYFTLDRHGAIREVNLAGAALLGVDRVALPGRSLIGFVAQPDRARYASHRRRLSDTGQPLALDIRLVRGDGSELYAHLEGVAAGGDGGDAGLCRLAVSDVSARKRAEEALKAAHDELERRVEERTAQLERMNESLQAEIVRREQVEASLRRSEERYRSFVALSSEAIWRVELEVPVPTTAPEEQQVELLYESAYLGESNETMARLYGIPGPGHMVGMRLGDILPRRSDQNLELLRSFVRGNYQVANAESVELDRHGESKHYLNNLIGIVEDGLLLRIWGGKRDVTERRRAEQGLRMQAQDLAILEERQRLARDLHDSISQSLYAIALGARTALKQIERDPQSAVASLLYVLSLTETSLGETRTLIFDLRPETLAVDGLVRTLAKQADFFRARGKMEVQLELGDEPDLPVKTKEALYTIGREALHNILKHAHAQHVVLRLNRNDQGVLLEIRDDGRGFDRATSFPGHLGLQSMRERVAYLGGRIEIDSAPGRGTHITVQIPIDSLPDSTEI